MELMAQAQRLAAAIKRGDSVLAADLATLDQSLRACAFGLPCNNYRAGCRRPLHPPLFLRH